MATFIDGFEEFDGENGLQLMRLAGYTVGGSVTIAGGRKSTAAIATYRSSFSREWTLNGNMLSVGTAVKFDARGPLLAIKKGADTMAVWTDPTTGLINIGTIEASGNPGYVNPLKDRWYYLELEMDLAARTATVFINGKADTSMVLPTWLSAVVQVEFNPYAFVTSFDDYGSRVFDDMYIADSARLSPLQITTRFPTADGQKNDWSITGAPSAWAAVSPEIDMLDKFIYSSVDGTQQTFMSGTPLPDGSPIRFLQLVTLFRKATSDPMSLDFNVDSQVVTESNISRDWTMRYTALDASGYTPASIVAAEFGVKLRMGI